MALAFATLRSLRGLNGNPADFSCAGTHQKGPNQRALILNIVFRNLVSFDAVRSAARRGSPMSLAPEEHCQSVQGAQRTGRQVIGCTGSVQTQINRAGIE